MTGLEPNNLSRGAATIIVADSDVLERVIIAEYLRHCAYRVIEAATSEEAIAILSKAEIKIEAALIDVELHGGVDGFGLARWIRANKPTVNVLLASTVAKAASVAADLCEDGPLMAKPYDKQVIVDRIKRLLAAAGNNRE